jgi:methionine sulfoxide reductase heme-binding subunit
MSAVSVRRPIARRPGDLRRRLLRHYLLIALASGAVLLLFMRASTFDANKYPPPGPIFFSDDVFGVMFPEQTGPAAMFGARGPNGMSRMQGMSGMGGGGHTGPPPGVGGAGHTGPPPGVGGANHTGPPAGGTNARTGRGRSGESFSTIQLMRRYTTATAYIALGLLAITLLMGPVNVLFGRRNPLSSYLRRDLGISCMIASVAHVVFGFLVNHGGNVLGYFLADGGSGGLMGTSFGVANYTGLVATLIVAALAVISSNAALRKLTARRWKRVQRLNYVLFALVFVHALGYGVLWRKDSPYTLLLGFTVTVVVAGQLVGVWLYRRREGRELAAGAAS